MAFKTAKEIEARKAFIAEADKGDIRPASLWSTVDLKKLNPDELIDRLEHIENQGNLMKWQILWALRQKFTSDKLFGQYLADARATRPNWPSSTRDVSRAVAAGRFCESHKITDLNTIGVSQSSIYALSSPVNSDIADKVFLKIKNKNLPNKDVERIIAQLKAVATIDHQKTTPMEYEHTEDTEQNTNQPVINENASTVLIQEVIDESSISHDRRTVLLRELAMIDASNVSDADAKEEMLLFIEQYKRVSFLKKIALVQSFVKALQESLRELQNNKYSR